MDKDLWTRHGALLRIVGIVFIGIHMPLVLGGSLWLAGGASALALLLAVFAGTVIGFLMSVTGIWFTLKGQTARAINP